MFRAIAVTKKQFSDLQGIAREYIAMLPKVDGQTLPMPKFAVVNRLTAKWLGQAALSDGETTIYLQKSLLGHEQTLRRVLAHEICHAWAFWHFQLGKPGDHRGHSPNSLWMKAVNQINQGVGDPQFISETSDMSYVTVNDKYFWVYIEENSQGLWWAWFSRVTDMTSRAILARATLPETRATVVRANDDRYLIPKGKLPYVARLQQTPEDMKATMLNALKENPMTPTDTLGEVLRRAKTV